MLYMVGNICLYGIRFNIVYSESGHKKLNILNTFFLQNPGKNINILKTEMEWHETALYCHTHIYLSNRTLQIQIVS